MNLHVICHTAKLHGSPFPIHSWVNTDKYKYACKHITHVVRVVTTCDGHILQWTMGEAADLSLGWWHKREFLSSLAYESHCLFIYSKGSKWVAITAKQGEASDLILVHFIIAIGLPLSLFTPYCYDDGRVGNYTIIRVYPLLQFNPQTLSVLCMEADKDRIYPSFWRIYPSFWTESWRLEQNCSNHCKWQERHGTKI